ncbi:MAG: glycosyltransferase family 4 protein [Candidatus Bathyarchaeia archaeon]
MAISRHIEKSASSKPHTYTVLLVCDFSQGLVSRLMDVYNFFREPPQIVLVRRGKRISFDTPLSIHEETIPLPVVGLENLSFLKALPVLLSYLLWILVLYGRICRLKIRVKLVHSQNIFPQGLFGLLLARLLNVPLIVTATGRDVNVTMTKWAPIRAVCLMILQRALVTAVSKPLQKTLLKFGLSQILYVPNSVDPSAIPAVDESAKRDSILYVGLMTKNKRPLLLLQAFEIVIRAYPTATLYMCGDGPQMEIVKREIVTRGLADRAKCLSSVSQRTLNQIRAKTALFVLPSATEGLSLALLEAMAAGQAVIASRNASHEAILENERTALLFRVDDSEELARQIMVAISDDDLRTKISQSAKALIERDFSNIVVARQWESTYLSALT